MEEVNIFPGRFEPFHLGHLTACMDAGAINLCSTVIFYILNEKFDFEHPFSNELIEKELNIIKDSYGGLIRDIIWIRRPMPNLLCRLLHERGMVPKLWLAGSDRIESYKKLIQGDKIRSEFGFEPPELIETKRYCSATDVRNALLANDWKNYWTRMPECTHDLYDEFREQILKINK